MGWLEWVNKALNMDHVPLHVRLLESAIRTSRTGLPNHRLLNRKNTASTAIPLLLNPWPSSNGTKTDTAQELQTKKHYWAVHLTMGCVLFNHV
jgi:hypothetical protein